MKKIISTILILVICLSSLVGYAAPETRGVSVIAALTDGQQIIYSKNPDERISPSGLTKLFTALVAYDLYDLDETVIVAENILEYTSNLELSAKLQPGEMLSFYDLLGAMVVNSANDASYQVAITCCGSVEAFVEKMNEKAKTLGLTNSNFTNPTGIYDANQYTSANDMLIIYRELYKNERLRNLVTSQRWIIEPTNVSKRRVYWTNNHLLSKYYETKYYYPYVTGGKISSSSEGGYSVVATASKGGINVLAIVLNSQLDQGVNYSLVDATEIFDYVFDNYTTVTAVKENELICEMKIKNSSDANYTLVNTKTQLKGIIKKIDSAEDIEQKLNVPEYLKAPLKKGDVIGQAEYYYDDNLLGKVDLVVAEDIGFSIIKGIGSGIAWFFNLKVVKVFIAVVIILAISFFMILIYLIKQQEEQKKRKNKRPSQKRGNRN